MRLQPGDVIEIGTPAGFAYAQVTHTHPAYPEVVRFFKGLHKVALKDAAKLEVCPVAFVAMFPLGGALQSETLSGRKLGSLSIPADYRSFPTFKMPIRDKQGGVFYWWLWQGDGLTFDVEQNRLYDALPMREVLSVSDLINKLCSQGIVPA